MATYPAEGDVRSGVVYGPNDNDFTGTLTLPDNGDVRQAVAYGAGGTELVGEFVVPAVENVKLGVNYGDPTYGGLPDTWEFTGETALADTTMLAIKAKTDNLPASPAAVGSAMTLAANAVSAAAVAADAVTELQSGLATAAAVADVQTDVDAIKAKTDNLPASPAAVGSAMTVSDKKGFKLAADGLDVITATPAAAVPTTFREMLVAVYRRFFKKVVRADAVITHYADDGTTPLMEQAATDVADVQTQGAAAAP